MRTGDILELEVGAVAHGGHCVARHEGRVVFVRHALPGERVRARVTAGDADSRYLRADAVEVLTASPDRVVPPCPYAGPGRCGGCDWQHAGLDAQRRLKADVVMEQLRRLAGIDLPVVVEPVPSEVDGLGWRTRVRYAVDAQGRAGFRRHRSHVVVPIDRCLIAHPDVDATGVTRLQWPGTDAVEVATSSSGERMVVIEPAEPAAAAPSRGDRRPIRPVRGRSSSAVSSTTRTATTGTCATLPAVDATSVLVAGTPDALVVRGRRHLREDAAGRQWRVSGGFWQVHPGAAEVLVGAVLAALEPQLGESALDLYSGVGLFAGALADRLGAGGSVTAIEGIASAVRDARRNLHDAPTVRLVAAPVEQWLAGENMESVDLVVLDPPRAGARRNVVERIAGLRPRAVAYVACDPAALARDLAYFHAVGYELRDLRAIDLFPMTHHVECVAALVRAGSTPTS